jgi:hypothetical protein
MSQDLYDFVTVPREAVPPTGEKHYRERRELGENRERVLLISRHSPFSRLSR